MEVNAAPAKSFSGLGVTDLWGFKGVPSGLTVLSVGENSTETGNLVSGNRGYFVGPAVPAP